MNVFRIDYFWHSWVMHSAVAGYEAQATLDINDFSLEVRARHRNYRFYPLFIVRTQAEQLIYVQRPDLRVKGFAGWLPYFNKRWPIGSGKFAFKEFCGKSGLPTPRFWRSPSSEMRDFLVKLDKSSFGSGMRGPFKSYQPREPGQAIGETGYYEQFIRGRTLKAWFWEDRLAAVEEYEMPAVTGDGKSRLRELIQRTARPGGTYANWDRFEDLARFQDTALDDVLAQGQTVITDISFSSPMHPVQTRTDRSLDRFENRTVLEKLGSFGPALWQGIPEDVRPASLYTVDAIVDPAGGIWLLEMNCNPAVHPETYPFMFETFFGPRAAAGAQDAIAAPVEPPAGALPRPYVVPPAPGSTRPPEMRPPEARPSVSYTAPPGPGPRRIS